MHRRHAASVTHSLKAQKHIDEIESMHRFARERLGFTNRETKSQAAYLDEVTAQLLGAPLEVDKGTRVAKPAAKASAKA